MAWRLRLRARWKNDRARRAALRRVRESPGSEVGARRCLRRVLPCALPHLKFCFRWADCFAPLVGLTQQAQSPFLLRAPRHEPPVAGKNCSGLGAGFPASAGGHSGILRCTTVRPPIWPLKLIQPMPNEIAGKLRPAPPALPRFESPPAHRFHSGEPTRPPAPGKPRMKQGELRNSRVRAGRGCAQHTPIKVPRPGNLHYPA